MFRRFRVLTMLLFLTCSVALAEVPFGAEQLVSDEALGAADIAVVRRTTTIDH